MGLADRFLLLSEVAMTKIEEHILLNQEFIMEALLRMLNNDSVESRNLKLYIDASIKLRREEREKVQKNSCVNISKLPDGTFFYVNNGCWQGYITTENGVKVCYAGASKKNPTKEYVNRFAVNDTYELYIDIL